jgi:hypothetical protein
MSREEHKLRVFASRLLAGLFGLHRGGVIRGSRKLHNEVLSNLRREMQVAWVRRRGMHVRFSWERQKERDYLDMWEDNIPMALMYCNMG